MWTLGCAVLLMGCPWLTGCMASLERLAAVLVVCEGSMFSGT